MNGKQTPMMRTNTVVAELNRVAGFDPVKLLQGSLNSKADEAEKLRLKLRYKKLWFRLAYPQGRIRLSALRITEQLAVIEARVYLHKEDPEPVSNFTAARKVQDSPLYIQAAQYEAQDNALTDAGFGIQLCDICQAVGEEAYTPKQAEKAAGADLAAPPLPDTDTTLQMDTQRPPAETGLADRRETVGAEPEATGGPGAVKEERASAEAQEQPPADISTENESTELSSETTGPAETYRAEGASAQETDIPTEDDTYEEARTEGEEAVPEPEDSYSPNMTMEEIAARMTLEEALHITADVGKCRGQTLAYIADRRPASLRWYIMGCKEASNVLKAGAKLVLDSLTMSQSA